MPDAFDMLGDAVTTDKGDITDYGAAPSEVFGAGAERQFDTNPAALLGRSIRIFNEDMASLAGINNRIDQKTAEEEVKSRGLDLKIGAGGITRYELDTLQYLKQREIRQNTVSARARGITGAAAGFAGGIAGSFTDPINVASNFIPFVSEYRYARWLAQAGESTLARAGVRVAAGAIEGAAGAAVVEPLVYGGATSQQLDYGLTDSFLNVTLGGVMGGGLHTFGGAVYDARVSKALRGLDTGLQGNAALRDAVALMPEHKQRELLQAAVEAMERGEPVDVTPQVARHMEDVAKREPGFMIYHVSPHKFDTPRLDAGDVGRTSGGWEEGAGLYGSNNPEVVRVHQELYRTKGSKIERTVVAYLDDVGGDVGRLKASLQRGVNDPNSNLSYKKTAGEVLDYLEKNGVPKGAGEADAFTYEWKVNGDRETEFVDFRKPIDEQNPAVLEKLKAAGIDPAKDKWFKNWVQAQMKGEIYDFAKDPAAARANALAISKRLREVGIKGAVYPTDREDITGAGDNFVIYDPRDVTPVSRNGEPIGQRTPRDLGGLIEQSRADRTQGAFDRQFVEDGRAPAPKPEPKDHIARAEADFEAANEIVDEFRKEGRLTEEDEASLKEIDTAVKRAELKATAVEAAAACMVAA